MGTEAKLAYAAVFHIFYGSDIKNPGYLLHDINIMEMFREYGNGDTALTGKVGLSGMQQANHPFILMWMRSVLLRKSESLHKQI